MTNLSSVKVIMTHDGKPKTVFINGAEVRGVRHVDIELEAQSIFNQVIIEMVTDKISVVEEE